jgi:uncharacterized protein DUF2188
VRTGGVEVPINGDVVVCRHATGEGEQYVVRTFPDSADSDAYRTRDEAVAAATALAAREHVSVFLWEAPHAPTLLKPFRTL